jgi:hypothetical protein
MRKAMLGLMALAMCGAAQAKLPPLSDEAKAAAEEAKNKAAWGNKVAAYELCLAQDRIAAYYFKTKEGAKKPDVATPPCVNPGPYVPSKAATADAKTAQAGESRK